MIIGKKKEKQKKDIQKTKCVKVSNDKKESEKDR